MPVFNYVGKGPGGKTVKGVMDVESVRALKSALRREKIFLTEYSQSSTKGGKGKVKAGAKQQAGRRMSTSRSC